jgi:hypothetical protein
MKWQKNLKTSREWAALFKIKKFKISLDTVSLRKRKDKDPPLGERALKLKLT